MTTWQNLANDVLAIAKKTNADLEKSDALVLLAAYNVANGNANTIVTPTAVADATGRNVLIVRDAMRRLATAGYLEQAADLQGNRAVVVYRTTVGIGTPADA